MIDLYQQDGVNISAGDAFSAFVGGLCRESYHNSRFVQVTDLSRGDFRGPRGWKLVELPDECLLTSTMDGIGTKVVLIDAAGNYQDAANDVVAMCAMDITRYGGLPLVFKNIIDVGTLGDIGSETYQHCQAIMLGLAELADQHKYVLLTGETAELGVCVGSENPEASVRFNWGGCMTGVYHPDKMILGDSVRPGQLIVVFRDTFRSNGISSVRKALAREFGTEWWKNTKATDAILRCAAPSVQYDRMLNRLHGWFRPLLEPMVQLHLVAHLSGGAFKGKLGSMMLRLGLTAELDNLFEPPLIMRQCAEWRGMNSEQCYETWNGGQGALIVIDEPELSLVQEIANLCEVDMQVAGRVVPYQGYSVGLTSRFDGTRVIYP